MANYIDKKHTIWIRYHFKEDTNMEEIANKLENNEDVIDDDLGFIFSEDLPETLIELNVEDNKGFRTVEVFKNNDNITPIWDNVKKFNVK